MGTIVTSDNLIERYEWMLNNFDKEDEEFFEAFKALRTTLETLFVRYDQLKHEIDDPLSELFFILTNKQLRIETALLKTGGLLWVNH